jgi:hypothetical protein
LAFSRGSSNVVARVGGRRGEEKVDGEEGRCSLLVLSDGDAMPVEKREGEDGDRIP